MTESTMMQSTMAQSDMTEGNREESTVTLKSSDFSHKKSSTNFNLSSASSPSSEYYPPRRYTGAFCNAFSMFMRSTDALGSWKAFAVQIIAVPIFTSLFYFLLGASGARFFHGESLIDTTVTAQSAGVSNSILFAALIGTCCESIMLGIPHSFASDTFEGTLIYELGAHRVSPMTWFGRLSAQIILIFATTCVTFLAATLWSFNTIRFMSIHQIISLIALVFLCILAHIGIGVAISIFSIPLTDAYALTNIFGYVIPLVCGIIAPAWSFPQILHPIIYAFPTSWLTDATRLLFIGADPSVVWVKACIGVIMGMAWLIVGILTLKVVLHISRKRGNIDNLNI